MKFKRDLIFLDEKLIKYFSNRLIAYDTKTIPVYNAVTFDYICKYVTGMYHKRSEVAERLFYLKEEDNLILPCECCTINRLVFRAGPDQNRFVPYRRYNINDGTIVGDSSTEGIMKDIEYFNKYAKKANTRRSGKEITAKQNEGTAKCSPKSRKNSNSVGGIERTTLQTHISNSPFQHNQRVLVKGNKTVGATQRDKS
jgi:hypothetical protein